MSDPPDNPPAYNAFVAGMYARAYRQLPPAMRTERMRLTVRDDDPRRGRTHGA